MKKFFTLFAMLSLAMSASADGYPVPSISENETCIFYEENGANFNHLYVFNETGDLIEYAGDWGGYKFTDCEEVTFNNTYTFNCVKLGKTSENHDLYKITLPTSLKE